jgi:fructokinase
MIYTLGESLLDVIFENSTKISAKSGGAMLNLSISLARCNLDVCLISELGDDKVANQITSFLEENNVFTKYIQKYHQQVTSLALAFLDEDKKPNYSFYKTYPQKRELKQPDSFFKNDILIFGSFYSLDENIRQQLKHIVETAKTSGALIIYDPNIRHAHHLENKTAMKSLKENFALANIIKGSDEDFENIFGNNEEDFILQEVRKINKQAIVVITRGDAGAKIFSGTSSAFINSNKIIPVSTIGAGDNFTAGMVYFLSQTETKHPKQFSENELKKLLRMANNFSTNVCLSVDNYISNEFANSLLFS